MFGVMAYKGCNNCIQRGREQTMEERLGLLEQVSGHTYDTIYDLLFTTERIIAVLIQHPTDVPYKTNVMDLFIGGQLTKQRELPERRRIADERRHACKEKPLDELVASHRLNFEIRYNSVTSVEVRRGFFRSHLKFHVIRPSTAKHTFHFTLRGVQVPNARHLVEQVLPLKLKGK
jgi:hypothetical protein